MADPFAGIPRVLLVTNDFPPRIGGVQQYEWNLIRQLPADRVAVLAPSWPGWRERDREQAFAVHRWPARFMWPTSDLARRIRSLVREHDSDVVVFGQGLPLPLIGPGLSARGVPYVVLTHGVELWMSRVPASRPVLARALGAASEITATSRYTAAAVRRAVPSGVEVTVLTPGVDERRFSPRLDGGAVRASLGLEDRKVVLCVSRLVARKGQDILIRGMAALREMVPEAALVVAGGGPYRSRLEALARESPPGSVVFGGEVSDAELPSWYAACDVFAMPCRSRWGGLEVEGFGIVFLEAAASGKAALAGRSGGAEEAVVDGETGLLVEAREPKAVALAVARLLRHRDLASAMGTAGRARVEREFAWPRRAEALARILRRAADSR